MRKLIVTIFPWKLHMHMLQLEEYKLVRFIKWIGEHPFRRQVESKKPFVVTQKVKLIWAVSLGWLLFFALAFDPIITLIISTQPFILYYLAVLSIKPYEKFNLERTMAKVRNKIQSNKKLTVIGIAGSYGKTSTKELLYQLIRDKFKTLRTPESYNTPFGIAKVVDLELDDSYEYFLCELGEYRKNEIRELSQMSSPSLGIITGITKQHFERFKSLRAIIDTIFELSDHVKDQNNMIYNIDNEYIAKEIEMRSLAPIWTYGIENKSARVRADHIIFTKDGASFTLFIDEKKHNVMTPLFGYGNIVNLLGAICMAIKIEVKEQEILRILPTISPAFNRSVIKKDGTAMIIDNTYISNILGFNETLKTASAVNGKKILITPGIVELGSEERNAHLAIGKQCIDIFDEIILVGKNSRTAAIFEGSGKSKRIHFIADSRADYQKAYKEAVEKYHWVFLENDVTQNY